MCQSLLGAVAPIPSSLLPQEYDEEEPEEYDYGETEEDEAEGDEDPALEVPLNIPNSLLQHAEEFSELRAELDQLMGGAEGLFGGGAPSRTFEDLLAQYADISAMAGGLVQLSAQMQVQWGGGLVALGGALWRAARKRAKGVEGLCPNTPTPQCPPGGWLGSSPGLPVTTGHRHWLSLCGRG